MSQPLRHLSRVIKILDQKKILMFVNNQEVDRTFCALVQLEPMMGHNKVTVMLESLLMK